MEGVIDLDLLEDIKGFEGLYQINIKGQVWSVRSKIFMKPRIQITKYGSQYFRFELRKDKARHVFYLHRLLAIQFLPNPLGLPQVDHIDIDSLNNSLDNLRWASQRTNINNRKWKSNTGEKNITFEGVKNYYRVQIVENKKRIYCKCFKTIEEAVSARDTYLRANNLD